MWSVKYVKWVLVAIYVYFILTQTLLFRSPYPEPIFRSLFWELQNSLWADIRLNIILFIPLGFLIGGWRGLLIGFCLSCGIEATQYFGRLGYCELDDILNNTIGAGIGAGLNVLIRKSVVDMGLRTWDELPEFMRTPEVRPYWEGLWKKRGQLIIKRIFDLMVSLILLVILAIPMAIITIMIKREDPGPALYRQERVTTYGKHFRIHKFRTMVVNADKIGTAVTVGEDPRITKVGHRLRRLRLDELPQVLDVICGEKDIIKTTKKNLDFLRLSAA